MLLAAFLLAHNLGDFTPLATERIRRAKAEGGPAGPIAAHAGVHAALVGLAVLVVSGPPASVVALAAGFEFATHFGIDFARARLGVRVPALADMRSNPFWWTLGIDQLLHALVLVGVAFIVLA